jgi:hypothetical protein
MRLQNLSKNFYYSDNEKKRICQYILSHTSQIMQSIDSLKADVDAGLIDELDLLDGSDIRRIKSEKFDASIYRRRRDEIPAIVASLTSYDDNTNWDVEAVTDEDDLISNDEEGNSE